MPVKSPRLLDSAAAKLFGGAAHPEPPKLGRRRPKEPDSDLPLMLGEETPRRGEPLFDRLPWPKRAPNLRPENFSWAHLDREVDGAGQVVRASFVWWLTRVFPRNLCHETAQRHASEIVEAKLNTFYFFGIDDPATSPETLARVWRTLLRRLGYVGERGDAEWRRSAFSPERNGHAGQEAPAQAP